MIKRRGSAEPHILVVLLVAAAVVGGIIYGMITLVEWQAREQRRVHDQNIADLQQFGLTLLVAKDKKIVRVNGAVEPGPVEMLLDDGHKLVITSYDGRMVAKIE